TLALIMVSSIIAIHTTAVRPVVGRISQSPEVVTAEFDLAGRSIRTIRSARRFTSNATSDSFMHWTLTPAHSGGRPLTPETRAGHQYGLFMTTCSPHHRWWASMGAFSSAPRSERVGSGCRLRTRSELGQPRCAA